MIQLRLQPGEHSHISRATGLGVHTLSDILTYEGSGERARAARSAEDVEGEAYSGVSCTVSVSRG